jgi:uncharacterized protein (DUF1684 family)
MLQLLAYRRTVAELYNTLRESDSTPELCAWFRYQRDQLFRTHSQSALDSKQQAKFSSLSYYPYDPAYRVTASIDLNVQPQTYKVDLGDDGAFSYFRFGQVNFTLPTGTGTLNLYWISGYGGGLFLPFGDTTNRDDTYGGGRYLYDTIKGADLGAQTDSIVLDFNYAYNPSCAYNPRWVCPLTPPENKLPFPVLAGEKIPQV